MISTAWCLKGVDKFRAGIKPPMDSFWAWWVNHEDKNTFQASWNDTFSLPEFQTWLNLAPPDALVVPVWIESFVGSYVAAQRRAKSVLDWREDATYVDFRNDKIHIPKDRVGRGRAQRKIAQVAAEALRVNEIAAAQLGTLT